MPGLHARERAADRRCEPRVVTRTTGVKAARNHKDLTIQDADAVAAVLAHYRKRPRLGSSDCPVLEVAR